MLAAHNYWVGQTIVFCGLSPEMTDDKNRSSVLLHKGAGH
jgi:hypothetical protein